MVYIRYSKGIRTQNCKNKLFVIVAVSAPCLTRFKCNRIQKRHTIIAVRIPIDHFQDANRFGLNHFSIKVAVVRPLFFFCIFIHDAFVFGINLCAFEKWNHTKSCCEHHLIKISGEDWTRTNDHAVNCLDQNSCCKYHKYDTIKYVHVL